MNKSIDMKYAVLPLGQVMIFIEKLDDFSPFYEKWEEGFSLSGTLDSLFLGDFGDALVMSSCPLRRPMRGLLIAN